MSHDVGQQKIIIDVDEEITTVIDQLRFVRSNNVGLVVPQRAVILQSVMNLKLLAQEAQRMRKKIVIITRDNDGMVFAQRAGIATQVFSADEEISRAPRVFEEAKSALPIQRERESVGVPQMQKVHKNIGAQSFLASQQRSEHYNDNWRTNTDVQGNDHHVVQDDRAHVLQKNYRTDEMMDHRTSQSTHSQYMHRQDGLVPQRAIATHIRHPQQVVRGNGFDIGNNGVIPQKVRQSQSTLERRSALAMSRDTLDNDHDQEGDDGIAQYERSLSEARIDRISSQQAVHDIPHKDQPDAHKLYNSMPSRVIGTTHARDTLRHIPVHDENMRSKTHKTDDITAVSPRARFLVKGLFFGAITLAVVIIFVIIAPKTEITVTPKHIVINDTVEITARVDQTAAESERRIVPARVIERDITFTKSFSATGKGDVNAQKAQGSIIIYNAYDDKPQSLVASTRFLAENGMLFRLVKTTTIPGMKNGEPGKVEALVIADKEGVEGNIGPTRFSIPGFDGSPKKEKFYAISEKAMFGGGTGGSGVALVSEDDIMRAQKEMEAELKQYVQEQFNAMIRPESEVLLPEAIISEITRSEPSVSAQTMSDQFMYEIVAHVYAMAFVQEDAVNILTASVDIPDSASANDIDMHLFFDNVQMDRENGMMRFSVQGNAELVATVVIDDFKKDIAGKKHDDLRTLIENRYRHTIEKITIESVFPQTPNFLGEKISRFEFMTHVSVSDPNKDEDE